jgi:hypothetical protein
VSATAMSLKECIREQARSHKFNLDVKAMTSNARRIIFHNLHPAP